MFSCTCCLCSILPSEPNLPHLSAQSEAPLYFHLSCTKLTWWSLHNLTCFCHSHTPRSISGYVVPASTFPSELYLNPAFLYSFVTLRLNLDSWSLFCFPYISHKLCLPVSFPYSQVFLQSQSSIASLPWSVFTELMPPKPSQYPSAYSLLHKEWICLHDNGH